MISGVIIHIQNDMPVLVDMEELPTGPDRSVRCTNVRGLDGKRPAFVHDRKSTFIFPLAIVRVIEVPHQASTSALMALEEPEPDSQAPVDSEFDEVDEENEEDLLARIRQI